jgi:hypothetical protein
MVESNRVHSKRMLLVKKEQILQKDWKDAFDEWHQSIKCIEECFSILFPSVYSYPNNRSDDRSDERACALTAVKGSTTVKAVVEEEEVESDESLDDDVAMSPYHQDESGVEWVEGDDDGHGDRDDDDDNQKTKVDEFNAHDNVDHHHLSTRPKDTSVQTYNLEEEEEEDEDEEFDDESVMPTGAVPYSLVSMLLSN